MHTCSHQVELKFRDNMTHTDIDVYTCIYIAIHIQSGMNYFIFTRDTSFTPNLRIREERIARDYEPKSDLVCTYIRRDRQS